MVRKTIYGSLVLVLIASIFFGTSVSHGPPKHSAAEFEIKALQDYASGNKELFLKMTSVDNASFVSATKPKGEIWKYNDKGELLDPWGKPYIISKNDEQIIITSPGLDQYNKLSSFQKWWSNE